MNALALHELRKVFADGTEAVRPLTQEFAAGEFVVLLGPSGCGKTTTLRMIAGLETPTSGRITLQGEDITARSPAERDIGFVFQFFALYPHLTVRENIAFPLRCAGLPAAERDRVIARVAERMGLGPLLARRPVGLSGGDQQRVGLARALVRSPRLFLMDEPLGTLDADQRYEMQEFIRSQQQELGVTTIYVTHDQEEAMSLADRLVVMDRGVVQQAAPPATVYDHPANLFVANFVGSPGMNFLPGAVERDAAGAGARFRLAAGAAAATVALPAGVRAGPATLGVRAEFVGVGPAEAGELPGTVAVNEFLGAARLLYVDTPAGRVVARVGAGAAWRPGAVVGLKFDPARLRLFDPASGVALAAGGPP